MRASFLSVAALAGLAFAAPVHQKRTDLISEVSSLLTPLLSTVQGLTGEINSTIAGVETITSDIVSTVVTDVTALTSELTSAISSLNSLSVSVSVDASVSVSVRNVDTDVAAVANTLNVLILEVDSTLQNAANMVGLNELDAVLSPVTAALLELVQAAENKVDGLSQLVGVVAITVLSDLNGLLNTLGLGAIGL